MRAASAQDGHHAPRQGRKTRLERPAERAEHCLGSFAVWKPRRATLAYLNDNDGGAHRRDGLCDSR